MSQEGKELENLYENLYLQSVEEAKSSRECEALRDEDRKSNQIDVERNSCEH